MPIDATDMLVVHRVFRREFNDLPALIATVPEGDCVRAKQIADHVRFIVTALHHHHTAEDDHAWPKLRARAPHRAIEIARMADEHAEIAYAVETVESLVAKWTKSVEPALTDQLAMAASELSVLVGRHLDDEERDAVPLIEQYLTQDEWSAATKQAASFITVRNFRLGIVLGGLVLEGASDGERRMILSGAPLPQRVVVQLFGARAAALYRRRLHGD